MKINNKNSFWDQFLGKKELLVTESHKLFGFWVMENEIGFVGHAQFQMEIVISFGDKKF